MNPEPINRVQACYHCGRTLCLIIPPWTAALRVECCYCGRHFDLTTIISYEMMIPMRPFAVISNIQGKR